MAVLDGKFYGATAAGGSAGMGTAFAFDPSTNGLTILHAFRGGIDGEQPNAGPIAVDQSLYGTTFQGGAIGFGTVYRLDPATRRLRTLHSFTSAADGAHPQSQPTALNGFLYGDTFDGGNAPIGCIDTDYYWGCGVIFKYDPVSNKTTIAHSFQGTDGLLLPAALTEAKGLLYGVTQRGGAGGVGTVFSLDPAYGLLTTLHSFDFKLDGGAGPMTPVIVVGDALYGIAAYGGSSKPCITGPEPCGVIFRIGLKSRAFTSVYRFSGLVDGYDPTGLTYYDGMIYGLTYAGGKHGRGSVFAIDPATDSFSSVYSFTGGADGANPVGTLTRFGHALYGVTSGGGTSGNGAIFKVTP